MTKKTVVMWRQIPAQVIIAKGRKKAKRILSDKFQKAIDQAAMVSGRADTDGYLEDWSRVDETLNDPADIVDLAKLEASRLEEEYNDERLSHLVKNGGLHDDQL